MSTEKENITIPQLDLTDVKEKNRDELNVNNVNTDINIENEELNKTNEPEMEHEEKKLIEEKKEEEVKKEEEEKEEVVKKEEEVAEKKEDSVKEEEVIKKEEPVKKTKKKAKKKKTIKKKKKVRKRKPIRRAQSARGVRKYDYRKYCGLPQKRSWQLPSSSFSSSTKRFRNGVINKNKPSPNTYKLKRMFDGKILDTGSSPFLSKSKRLKDYQNENPAPGHYKNIKIPDKREKVSFSKGKRFRRKYNNNPGPMKYDKDRSYRANNKRLQISSPFQSKTKRRFVGNKGNEHIPHSYLKEKDTSVFYKRGDQGAGSFHFGAEKRFKYTSHKERYATPPPGSYYSKAYQNFKNTQIQFTMPTSKRFYNYYRKGSAPSPLAYQKLELPESYNKIYKKNSSITTSITRKK